jgi:hypothetical protein
MNNLIYLLAGILLIALLLMVFYNDLFKSGEVIKYDLISDTKHIDQDFEKRYVLSEIIPNRDTIIIPGYGEGLTFAWKMFIPNTMGERGWLSNFNKDKPLIRIGDSPHIYYNPKNNVLKVVLKYKETPFYAHYPVIELKDIPLQTWNHYTVVINGNTVIIYFNGKQVKNHKLNNIPIISNNDIILGEMDNNIIGSIKDFSIHFRPYDTYEIRKIF